MAATPPSDSKSETPVPVTFEDNLNLFWKKNRVAILVLCAVVILAIIGKGLYESHVKDTERSTEAAFAAATTPDQRNAFVAAHPGHPLAGVAELQIADDAYAAGKFADAASNYEKAASTLKTGPLAARARLGGALALVQSGKASDGTARLKQLAGDTNELKAIRAEAAYQLASLAADAGNTTDVQTYLQQVNQIDPASVWARRAVSLQASLPRPAAPAAAAPAKPAESGPSLQLKVPGK